MCRRHPAEEGSKCDVAGIDQITAVLTVTLEGNFLPVQLVYQGKASAYLPRHVQKVHLVVALNVHL